MIKFIIDSQHFFSIPTTLYPNPESSLELLYVSYHSNKKCIPILYDLPLAIMRNIVDIIKKALSNDLSLPKSIPCYQFGYLWNFYSYSYWNIDGFKENNDFNDRFLFSINDTQTFIYNVGGKIIIEIIPSYPWTNVDPEEGQIIPTFESFMQHYKPIAIHTIEKKVAQNWLDQANNYLSIVEPQFEAWSKQPGEHQKQLYRFKNDA